MFIQKRYYTIEKETIKDFLYDNEHLLNSKNKLDPSFNFQEYEKKKKIEKNEELIIPEITDDFYEVYKDQMWKATVNEKQAERLGTLIFCGMSCVLGYFGWWVVLAYYYHKATSIMGYEKEDIWEEQDDQDTLDILSSLTDNMEDVIIAGNSEEWRSDVYIQDFEEDDISPSVDLVARFSKMELFVIQGPLQWQDRVYNQYFRPLPFYSTLIKYIWKKNAKEYIDCGFLQTLQQTHDLNLIFFDWDKNTKYKKNWDFFSKLIEKKKKKPESYKTDFIKTKSSTKNERHRENIFMNLKKWQEQELEFNGDFIWGVFGREYYDFLADFENDFYPILMYHDFIRRDFGLNLRENHKVIDDPFILFTISDTNNYDALYERQKYYSFLTIPKKRSIVNTKLKIYKNKVYSGNPYDSYMNLSFLSLPRNKN